MNRSKSATRVPAAIIAVIIITAIIGAFGGVLHVIYKNRQVQANREIDAIEHRIQQYQLDIGITQMRTQNLLDRYAVRDRLKEAGSTLRPIPLGVSEDITPVTPPAVATALP